MNQHTGFAPCSAPVTARSWGSESAQGVHPRAQIRQLVVHPGQRTALAAHCHRTEHWTVVQGTGTARIGGVAHRVIENRTLTVPAGADHALENTGHIDLYLVAVEVGSYLGDDDLLAPLTA